MQDVVLVLAQAIRIYQLLLFARILLTWLPNLNWYNQPFRALAMVTDPYLEPFRRLVPPIGMIDISPMVALFVLYLIQNALFMLLM